jgi:hypothetical protein
VTRQRRDQLPSLLEIDLAKSIAAERVKQMDEILAIFEQDSFGRF